MHTLTVAVDLAKNVFELAVSSNGKITERRRLNRSQLNASGFFDRNATWSWRLVPALTSGGGS